MGSMRRAWTIVAALAAALTITTSAAQAERQSAVARTFAVQPSTFTPASAPTVKVRVNKRGVKQLRATLLFEPTRRKRGRRTTVGIGQIPVNRTGVVPVAVGKLQPGRYRVRISVAGRRHVPIQRTRRSPGRTTVVVKPAPPPSTAAITAGVFPVAGPHDFGGADARFGTGRPGHTHEGQDVLAASGTPIVAPVAGTIGATSYQALAAGYYLVLNALDGRAFFMAHLLQGSTAVVPGQPVTQGQPLAQVGATGNANGPHLHFEYWPGGWRTPGSYPVDPLPQLLYWNR